MARLSREARDALPASDFAIPERREYPIHDRRHAVNALARVSEYGTPADRRRVRAAVYRRYPDLARARRNVTGGG